MRSKLKSVKPCCVPPTPSVFQEHITAEKTGNTKAKKYPARFSLLTPPPPRIHPAPPSANDRGGGGGGQHPAAVTISCPGRGVPP